ncbi:hypothetical protein [Cohnella silvisoli]|uniref:Uncharacterized protein n=1 Tax=Cohnella silvisoli TaxID=2873699 RepID=A0ABV1L2G5_9BACL|nr:hypothetical protein [Cohnella silvisoli]MCD9025402.1 hypothetical protein [Cohnella silvisoli]
MIMYPLEASRYEKFAAKEIRRYVYLLTSLLLPIVAGNRLSKGASGIVVGYPDNALIESLNLAERMPGSGSQEYFLKTLTTERFAD